MFRAVIGSYHGGGGGVWRMWNQNLCSWYRCSIRCGKESECHLVSNKVYWMLITRICKKVYLYKINLSKDISKEIKEK